MKFNKKRWNTCTFIVALTIHLSHSVYADEFSVCGFVSDVSSQERLENVTVFAEGNESYQVFTDQEGHYCIDVTDALGTISFLKKGYVSESLSIRNQPTLDATLSQIKSSNNNPGLGLVCDASFIEIWSDRESACIAGSDSGGNLSLNDGFNATCEIASLGNIPIDNLKGKLETSFTAYPNRPWHELDPDRFFGGTNSDDPNIQSLPQEAEELIHGRSNMFTVGYALEYTFRGLEEQPILRTELFFGMGILHTNEASERRINERTIAELGRTDVVINPGIELELVLEQLIGLNLNVKASLVHAFTQDVEFIDSAGLPYLPNTELGDLSWGQLQIGFSVPL